MPLNRPCPARRAAVSLAALAFLALSVAARPAAALQFRIPVSDPAQIWVEFLVHVDHDPVARGDGDIHCLVYDGREDFPYCYDQHDGTDFILDGGFPAMDAGSLAVVAAAGGEVTRTVDGNYDRCHAELGLGTVTCDGNPIRANYVEITHDDGTVTWYYHLKKGSVAVTEGQRVRCGDVLGLVGSSGVSSMPHVHFEVHDADGDLVDPYAGTYSQPESWWVVEDAGNGLPGPWCEGDPVPPEPEPDLGPELLPEPFPEPSPEPLPDLFDAPDAPAPGEDAPPADLPPVDPGAADEAALSDRVPDLASDDVPADAPADPGPRLDAGGIFPGSAGGFCAAGRTAVAGPGTALLLTVALAALGRARRRRPRAPTL